MRVLVFAPHNDDEVLGVGGTIAKYSYMGHDVFVCEVTSGNNSDRVNLLKSEAKKAHEILGVKESVFLDLPVVGLREFPMAKMNEEFAKVVKYINPIISYIPHKGDMHMDHAIVSHSAMVAMRPLESKSLKGIYVYETLSETEWNIPSVDNVFIPNIWNDISQFIDKKKAAMDCYNTQIKEAPHPRSLEIIEALAKLRGSTIGVSYAESFMLVRKIL